jgi:hypothetical protein
MNNPTNRRMLAALLTGLMLIAACQRDEPKTARLQDALPGMPLPGDPVFVSRSGSEDALQVVLTTGMKPDEAAAFYRNLLSKAPWKLVSDQPFESTGRVLYASRNGPPLWVTIKPNPNGIGSQISLNGAVAPKGAESPAAAVPADTGKKPKP